MSNIPDKGPRRVAVAEPAEEPATPVDAALLADVRSLIEASRRQVARVVNSTMVLTYWRIGARIATEIIADERGEYGKRVMERLAAELAAEYGSGFSKRNLFQMVRVARVFPDPHIVQTLSAQLGWSHFIALATLEDALQREFYAQMCTLERWSVRTLQQKMQGMLFERTAISRKPEALAVMELETLRDEDRMSTDLVFRDEYFLHFLGLREAHSERDLEEAILREMEGFIAELGSGFTFVARQKRMTVDGIDYRLDLLFFHRRLRRLIAIDLKLGRFQAGDKGQMELYLRWLQKYEQCEGEEPPLGLILCAGKSEEHVELLELERSGIRVAEYTTELPARELLEARLRGAVEAARERIDSRVEQAATAGD